MKKEQLFKVQSEKSEQHNQRDNRSNSTGIFVSNRAYVPHILKGRPQRVPAVAVQRDKSTSVSTVDMQDSDEKGIMRTKRPTHDRPIVSFSEYKPYSCRHAKVPSNEKSVIIKKPPEAMRKAPTLTQEFFVVVLLEHDPPTHLPSRRCCCNLISVE
jgi:hypothetical protein